MRTKRIIFRFVGLLLMLFCLTSFSTAIAAESNQQDLPNSSKEEISVRAEQTEWHYRIYNGKLQRRLWSITYGYWKTDWMDC